MYLPMNPQERDQLTHFLTQLQQAGVTQKLPEADALIREAASKQPDAIYLLVQRNMLMEQALNAAKAQILALQKQVQEQTTSTRGSFLGGNPWGQPPEGPTSSASVPGASNYQVPRAAPMVNSASSGPSFLSGIASTAAGVVAGSFLFQGIESLLGHHSGGFPSDFHASNDHPGEQTIVNNYYGSETDPSWSSDDSGDTFLANDDGYYQDDSDDSTWV